MRGTGPAEAGSAATRRRLLGAAAHLFQHQGFRATGLRQIAREAGVAVGTVYAHFPHKRALLLAVLEDVAKEVRRELAWIRLTPGRPAAERWTHWRRALEQALPWLLCEAEAGLDGGIVGCGAASEEAGRRGSSGSRGAESVGDQDRGPVTAAVREALASLLDEGARRTEVRLPVPDAQQAATAVLAAAVGLWRVGQLGAVDVLWTGLRADPAFSGRASYR